MVLPGRLGLVLCVLVLFLPGAFGQDEALQKKINRAIERGAGYLKSLQKEGGTWDHHNEVGMTALAAWTLLESGVPDKDSAVQRAADFLRQRCIELSDTYALALSIIFFDRLGEAGDEALIQAMAMRLLAGQTALGGWDYGCGLDEGKRKRLRKFVIDAKEKPAPPPSEKKPAGTRKFPAELSQLLNEVFQQPKTGYGDNSNTQFAMLALWVARRHGAPVDEALDLVDKRFRKSQQATGAWGYTPSDIAAPRATMTCAGLLGLALGHGIKPKLKGKPGPDIRKDPKVQAGLRLLGDILKNPDGTKEKAVLDNGAKQPNGLFCYFLFSLERMAVVYDLKTIGDKDWYVWGAEILVDRQNGGAWSGEHGVPDTCFALLFLKRANVAKDLTMDLNPKLLTPILKDRPKKKRKTDPELSNPVPKDKKPKTKAPPAGDEAALFFPGQGRLSKLELWRPICNRRT